jgi:hypothetical protein
MRSKTSPAGGPLVALACLLVAGCGARGTGHVSGKVEYDGRPLDGGTVFFAHENGAGFQSLIKPDGSYEVNKIPVGRVRIAVQTPKPYAGKGGGEASVEGLPPEAQEQVKRETEGRQKTFTKIPDVYGDAEKSGLTLDVTGGDQTFDIKLPARPPAGK